AASLRGMPSRRSIAPPPPRSDLAAAPLLREGALLAAGVGTFARKLAERDLHCFLVALTKHPKLDGRTWYGSRHLLTQRAGVVDRVAVKRGYDVAGFDSCFGCRAVRLGLGDERTLRALETHIIGNLSRHRLDLYAEPAARDVPLFAELVNNHLD